MPEPLALSSGAACDGVFQIHYTPALQGQETYTIHPALEIADKRFYPEMRVPSSDRLAGAYPFTGFIFRLADAPTGAAEISFNDGGSVQKIEKIDFSALVTDGVKHRWMASRHGSGG